MENIISDSVERESGKARREERGRVRSWAWPRALQLLAGVVASGVVFFYLQFSTRAILDVDGYYHIRWSRLLWEGLRASQFPPAFPWLPLTTLNPQDYVDHHLFFHILQIPFTWFADIRLGAKVAAAVFGTLAVVSCYWLILRYRIKYPLLWLAALLASAAPFLYRMSMARAQSVSIIFMVAGIYFLFERRYRLLAPLAFLYVWTYSLFVMLCAAAVIWAAVVLWGERRVEWRPVVWTALGTLAGFVINPYFPDNIRLFTAHLLMKAKPTEFTTSVGMEWYPYESWYLLGSCFVAFAAMLAGYVAYQSGDKRRAARPLFFLIFSTILLIMTARSRRFVEYWPPFAVLFAAFSMEPLLAGARRGAVAAVFSTAPLPSDARDEETDDIFVNEERREIPSRGWRRVSWQTIAAAFVALVLAAVAIVNVRETSKEIAGDQPPEAYRGGMEWIRQNVPPGERIFNTDWDDFPKMFFYDTTHAYASGLDPTYLLEQDPELSNQYVEITLGKNNYEAGPVIRERFGARYVFSDKEEIHDGFFFKSLDSGWFEKVYEDDYCAVLRIRDEKDAPGNKGAE